MKLSLFMYYLFSFFFFEKSLKELPFYSPILSTLCFRYLQTRIKESCMDLSHQLFYQTPFKTLKCRSEPPHSEPFRITHSTKENGIISQDIGNLLKKKVIVQAIAEKGDFWLCKDYYKLQVLERVSPRQSYLMGRKCLFSLGCPPF